jgi:hypothetical protein
MSIAFKSLARRHVRQLIILVVMDAILFASTNARTVPSLLLIAGFVLLLLTIYHLIYGLLAFIRLYGVNIGRQSRLALYLTGLAGVVVGLQSTGELSPRDLVVLLPLAGLAYLYNSYGVAGA